MPPASPGISRCRWKTTAGCISGENVQEHTGRRSELGKKMDSSTAESQHSLLYLNCYSPKLFYRPDDKTDFLNF